MLTSFFNKETNKEYIQGGQISDEFSITAGSTEYTGSNSSWSLVDNTTSLLKQGEIQLIAQKSKSLSMSILFFKGIYEKIFYIIKKEYKYFSEIRRQNEEL